MNPVVKRWPTVATLLGFAPDDVAAPLSSQVASAAASNAPRAAAVADVEAWLTALKSSTEIAVRIKAVRALSDLVEDEHP